LRDSPRTYEIEYFEESIYKPEAIGTSDLTASDDAEFESEVDN
jgi:hypothetical protein